MYFFRIDYAKGPERGEKAERERREKEKREGNPFWDREWAWRIKRHLGGKGEKEEETFNSFNLSEKNISHSYLAS